MKFSIHNFSFMCMALVILCLISCEKKKAKATPKTGSCSTSFNDNVYPIMANSCAIPGCHVSGAKMGDFTNYDGIKPKVDNGKFYKLVIETQTMPIGSSLTDDEIQTLTCWISDGAPNN